MAKPTKKSHVHDPSHSPSPPSPSTWWYMALRDNMKTTPPDPSATGRARDDRDAELDVEDVGI